MSLEYGEEACTQIIDMFEDSAIVRFYSFIDGRLTLNRVHYSLDEHGCVILGEVNEVHITYEDILASALEETGVEQTTEIAEEDLPIYTVTLEKEDDEDQEDDSKDEGEVIEDNKDSEEETEELNEIDEEKPADPEECSAENVVDAAQADNTAVETAQVINAEVATEEKVSADNDESQQEENSGAASFTKSERAELEALKREKKINLVDSYKASLSEEQYDNFISNIDSFENFDSLELELLKIYKKSAEVKSTSTERAFAFAPVTNNKTQNSLDSFVRKYKR